MLKKQLQSRANYWKNMPRSSEEERNQAEEYYHEEILPLLIDYFVKTQKCKVEKQYDAMFLTLGDTYYPLILSIKIFQPSRVCFIHTDENEDLIDIIVEYTGLPPSKYKKCLVKKDSAIEVYQEIKKIYELWGQPENIAVDITGGTKVMSAGAAMAAEFIGADIFYVNNNDYRRDLRRPFPGSEFLQKIPSPYRVFGDLEERKALALFANYDYTSANKIFTTLQKQAPDPRKYELLSLLCCAYEAWDNLDIATAYNHMTELVEKIRQYCIYEDFKLAEYLPVIEKQLDSLKKLQEINLLSQTVKNKQTGHSLVDLLKDHKFVIALMLTFYCNALRRKQQKKYDMSALLLYRLLELISQARLAEKGIDAGKADYQHINTNQLINTLNSRYKKYNNNQKYHKLPEKLTLLMSYVLLKAMGDDLGGYVNLENLQEHITTRNYNIFAHGFEYITEEKCSSFLEFVKKIMAKYLGLMGEDMDELVKDYSFLDLR